MKALQRQQLLSTSADLANCFLNRVVIVKTLDPHVTVSGILVGVDRGCHGGLGNVVVQDPHNRGPILIRGDCVAVVARL